MAPTQWRVRNLSPGPCSFPVLFTSSASMRMRAQLSRRTEIRNSRKSTTCPRPPSPCGNASRRVTGRANPCGRFRDRTVTERLHQTGVSSASGGTLRSRRVLGTLEHSCDAFCAKTRYREHEDRDTKYGYYLEKVWSDAARNRDSHSHSGWPIAKLHRTGLRTDAAVTLFQKIGERLRKCIP